MRAARKYPAGASFLPPYLCDKQVKPIIGLKMKGYARFTSRVVLKFPLKLKIWPAKFRIKIQLHLYCAAIYFFQNRAKQPTVNCLRNQSWVIIDL